VHESLGAWHQFLPPLSSIEAFGLAENKAEFNGAWFIDAAAPSPEFEDRFRTTYGREITAAAAHAYDTVQLIVEAFEKAGNGERKPSTTEVANFLRTHKKFHGMVGDLTVDYCRYRWYHSLHPISENHGQWKRKGRVRHRTVKVVVSFTLAFFTLCGSCLAEPLKVGILLGLTGAADRWSKYQRMGMELAAEDLKAEGNDIQLIFEDSRTEPSASVSGFNKLHDIDKVNAVVGDVFSFLTAPLIPLADRRRKLLVSPATPSQFCKDTTGMFFSTATQVPLAIDGYAKFLDTHPKVKKVAIIFFQDPGWGYQYRDVWKKLLVKRGISITDEFESAEFNQDFKTVLLSMLRKNPDAFFVAHHPQNFLRAARQNRFTGPIVFANNILEVPAAKESMDQVEGVYFVDTLAPNSFMERFRKRFNEDPLLEPYNGYEAVRTVVRALRANPQAPEKALSTLKYSGITGQIDFSSSCAGNQSKWYLKRFVEHKIMVLR